MIALGQGDPPKGRRPRAVRAAGVAFTLTLPLPEPRGGVGVVLPPRSTAAWAWRALAFTPRKELVRWVEEAGRPETRARRIAEGAARLAAREPRR